MLLPLEESTGHLLRALHFSAEKHRDQRRKDGFRTPYINHPIAVAFRLWDTGAVRDPVVLTAAVLHDTLEDTDTTVEEILAQFGQDVLTVVQEVTDNKALPKDTRKQLQIEHAPFLSTRAKLIKLSDKSCNLFDLIHYPPSGWSLDRRRSYLLWTEQVVSRLRGTNSGLENKYDEILSLGKKLLNLSLTG